VSALSNDDTITLQTNICITASLKLQGADALQHPLYTTELKRVKQYFAKIEAAENPVGPRKNMSLNKEATARILKADLVGLLHSRLKSL
jgi:hypothetical protein